MAVDILIPAILGGLSLLFASCFIACSGWIRGISLFLAFLFGVNFLLVLYFEGKNVSKK